MRCCLPTQACGSDNLKVDAVKWAENRGLETKDQLHKTKKPGLDKIFR